jgi:hypothetical protein
MINPIMNHADGSITRGNNLVWPFVILPVLSNGVRILLHAKLAYSDKVTQVYDLILCYEEDTGYSHSLRHTETHYPVQKN